MNPNCTKKKENQSALATSTSLDVSWNLDAVGAPFNPNCPRLVSPLEPITGFPFFFPANSQGWSQFTTSSTSKNTLELNSREAEWIQPPTSVANYGKMK
jgi:hypothetical protein